MMKRGNIILGLSNLFKWLKFNLNEVEEDPDDRALECSLIRCMSDYRRVEISEIRISFDFDSRLLKALEQIEIGHEENSSKLQSILKSNYFRYSLAFSSISLLVAFFYINLSEPSQNNFHTAGSINLDPTLVQELSEEFQLIREIRNSDDIQSLKKLEEYYITHGITDRATRIHYSLETISSK